MSNRRGAPTTVTGIVTRLNSRTARSGQFAHSFSCNGVTYSLFTDEAVVAFQDGDVISFAFEKRHLQSGSRMAYLRIIPDSVEILAPSSSGAGAPSFVYMLRNSAMPGLLKVGFTTGTPEVRAAELSAATGVPTPFQVE